MIKVIRTHTAREHEKSVNIVLDEIKKDGNRIVNTTHTSFYSEYLELVMYVTFIDYEKN